MTAALGVNWDDAKGRGGRLIAAFLAVFLGMSLVVPGAGASLAQATSNMVSVIVRAVPGASESPQKAVKDVGGQVGRQLDIINGFEAKVPAGDVAKLSTQHDIVSVSPNARGHLESTTDYSAADDGYSMANVTQTTGAQNMWAAGYTGKGVGVALIDSGVAPVDGMTAPGKLNYGPDLSFESQSPDQQYLDTYGHGTHMAGIIGGRDDAAVDGQYVGDTTHFLGMAPDSSILSIKAADALGATDVSQVIAAIGWVVQHKDDTGTPIRVINLSFGTNSNQAYVLDPLALAVEAAWQHGIVVVAAAGNTGAVGLTNPAYDPFILAVGATDTKGTETTADDVIATFSSRGNGVRNPDLAAPGAHIQSLRDAGSYLDQHYGDTGRINDRFFRGSGTSQAAALVSGAVALVLQQHPDLTPNQLKALLVGNTTKLTSGGLVPVELPVVQQGNGEINLGAVKDAAVPANAVQNFIPATGLGTLQAARGSVQLVKDGVALTGEQDIKGHAWNAAEMAQAILAGTTWSGGDWNGTTWSGTTWSGTTWSGTTWSGTTWSGTTWSGTTWSGTTWSGTTWSGTTWSGTTWSGTTWSGTTWSGTTWSNDVWM